MKVKLATTPSFPLFQNNVFVTTMIFSEHIYLPHIHFEMKSTLLLEIHKCHYILKRWSYLVEARFPGKLLYCNLFYYARFYKVRTQDQIEP